MKKCSGQKRNRICDRNMCCGCGACAQICPKKCISMAADQEGFLYPVIDDEQCVGCGKCSSVCPILNSREITNDVSRIFAAYSLDDDIRMNSSSGGIFSLLANAVLDNNGVVFGAAFDSNWLVHHVAVDKSTELSKLRGSKYLQSRIENTYAEAEMLLKQGRRVLFSGTGCQIAGLKRFLGKDYAHCYTVDILCHGVPSPYVWEKYLSEKKTRAGNEVKDVFFRDKTSGWKTYSTRILLEDNKKYVKKYNEDTYMRLFLRNIDLRPSCHNCQFKSVERVSDLTIGDAWGIEKVMPEFSDDKGTSLVLVHSQKGLDLLNMIYDKVYIKEGEIDTLLPVRSDARKSVEAHINRRLFFKKLQKSSGIECMEKYLSPSIPQRARLKIRRILKDITSRY